MKRQQFSGTPTGHRFALCPSTIVAGDAVLIGAIPAVANTSYSSTTGGADFYYNGSFYLSVTAKSTLSPAVNAAVSPGENVYADGGTLDSATNITHSFTLDANSSTGTLFGQLDPIEAEVAAGTTSTVGVKIGA